MSKKVHKIDLLLRDICMRLPFEPRCRVRYIVNNETTDGEDVWFEEDYKITRVNMDLREVYTEWTQEWHDIKNVKLYLRPMKSLSKDEIKDINDLSNKRGEYQVEPGMVVLPFVLPITSMKEIIDWYYSKHIDISDIIKDGNAVEMPEKIYNEIFQ
jgi:hypothetical protein